MYASATRRWSPPEGNRAERYCGPMSLPWRLSCVGSWTMEKKSFRSWPYVSRARVVGDADRLGVLRAAGADGLVVGRLAGAAGIPGGDGEDAFHLAVDGLRAPETPAGEDSGRGRRAGRA